MRGYVLFLKARESDIMSLIKNCEKNKVEIFEKK